MYEQGYEEGKQPIHKKKSSSRDYVRDPLWQVEDKALA